MNSNPSISAKAQRVLNIILLCLLLILLRVWYLAVIQHDEQLIQAHKPQRRVVIEPVERATIRDRFNLPLALNKMQYNAAVCYADIRQIPSIVWKKDAQGKPIRVQARVEHITELAKILGVELGMDPIQIEDIIYGKASLFPHTPFVIKEELTEREYFRLRMLERQWLGLQTQRATKRFYPQGKVGCDVLGYLGAISQNQYLSIAEESRELEAYLAARERNENPFLPKGFDNPLQVRERLAEIQEKAYTINDMVGKAGVEAFYEEELRGFHGKKTYEVDVKGNFLRELPGSRAAVNGRCLTLSLSAELQAFAEELLAANEGSKGSTLRLDERWMKGGAIVAMVPKTGEVVAMASYPRFDPNDFVPTRDPERKKEKIAAVQQWLENEAYIGEIWDGKRPLEREYFSFLKGSYQYEHLHLSWDRYLEAILPPASSALSALKQIGTIQTALRVQEIGTYHPLLKEIKRDEDKQLVVDLCHLAAPQEIFSAALIDALGSQSLSEYNHLRQLSMRLQGKIKTHLQEMYHDHDFTAWRQAHFKEFLKTKRKEEKEQHKYAKPYTDYLDQVEKKLFSAFWEAYRLVFLHTLISGTAPISLEKHPHLYVYVTYLKSLREDLVETEPSMALFEKILKRLNGPLSFAYLSTMRSFEDLKTPLGGRYRRLRQYRGVQTEKNLAAAFYPVNGYGYGRSQAFRQSNPLGSVFKLVPTYQCLLERSQQHKELNPLTLIDDLKGDRRSTSMSQVLGQFLDGRPILRRYKGGMLPRSSYSGMGKLDVIGALEQSSNIYFSIMAADYIEDPENLAEAARQFGFGRRTGADISGEERGNVPDDLAQNPTGLYSFAIGQHTLLVTPLQTSVMLSTIGLHGDVVTPKIVKRLEGKQPLRQEDLIFSGPKFPYQEALSLVGIHFPLFTAAQKDRQELSVYSPPTQIQRSLIFPTEVHGLITEGMRRSVLGARGSARMSIMRNLYDHPQALKAYGEVKNDILAKTGTAQVRYKQTLDAETPAEMRVFIWFSALAYPPGKGATEEPELAVVVLLRFGRAGRDAGPIAAQIIKKWRELRDKYESQASIKLNAS